MNKFLLALLLLCTLACSSNKKSADGNGQCANEGTLVDYTGLDGCQFLIVMDNGEKWLPMKVSDENFTFVNGLRIRFDYIEKEGAISVCMAESKAVELTCIEAVEGEGGKPNIPQCHKTKDPTTVNWMKEVLRKYPVTKVLRYDYIDGFAYFFRTKDKGYLYSCQGFFICEVEGKELSQCHRSVKNPESGLIIWQNLGQRD
ncbi:MAG: hypothetical protein AAGG75_15560 [Bacteroidota bacterium]